MNNPLESLRRVAQGETETVTLDREAAEVLLAQLAAKPRALTNAERQRRWREKRRVARLVGRESLTPEEHKRLLAELRE